MTGSVKQIAWATEIINKLEDTLNTVSDSKSIKLISTVLECCKADDTYAGDVIDLFAQAVKENADRVAPVAAGYMRRIDNNLRNTIYAAATK